MTALTPRQFERLATETFAAISRLRHQLVKEYAWAYGAGLDRTVQEQAKIRSTNPSTPTETIAASKAHVRRSLEEAVKDLTHARQDVEAAHRGIILAMDTLDPSARPEPLRYPRTVTNAELEESRSALDRRRAMGEAIP